MSTGPDTALVLARHHAVNTLVGYLRAVDDQDLPGVLARVGRASVGFGGPAVQGEPLAELYRSALAAGGRTRHLLHEVEVGWAEDGVRVAARAGYQRWSLESDPPTLTALGQYRAVFLGVEDGELELAELIVHRDWQSTGPAAGATPGTPASPN